MSDQWVKVPISIGEKYPRDNDTVGAYKWVATRLYFNEHVTAHMLSLESGWSWRRADTFLQAHFPNAEKAQRKRRAETRESFGLTGDGAEKAQRKRRVVQNLSIYKLLREREILFAKFFDAYPKKVGQEDAAKAWMKLTDADKTAAFQALPGHIDHVFSEEKEFIPNPATWLNKGRFRDEIDDAESFKPIF